MALGAAAHRAPSRGAEFLRYLAEEIWPHAPAGEVGRRLTRDEEEALLGLGPEGV